MSGYLHEVATPCPRRSKRTGDERDTESDPFDSPWNPDTTSNIDFTTEIKVSTLTGAKPKRKTKTASFTIHSDLGDEAASARETLKPKREIKPAITTASRKTSLLAQPAQRFRPRVSFAPSPLKHSKTRDNVEHTKRNTKPDVEKNNELLRRISGSGESPPAKDALKGNVRRNTAYIPPEATTVASVFMGLFSPLKSNNTEPPTSEDTQVGSLELQLARKRQEKRSLASSPGRVPLKASSKIAQESYDKVDVPGKNGGKENIPPGMVLVNSMGKVNKPTKFDSFMSEKVSPSKGVFEKTRGVIAPSPISKPLAARSTNKPVHKTDVISQPTVASKPALSRKRSIKTAPKELVERSSTLSNTLGASRSVMSSSISRSSLKRINQEYPLVPENITSPAMYDDSWLSHQEVILSQLINGLFQDTDGDAKIEDPIGLRRKLLQIYQGPYFTNLYQRLHASMLYGALSIPKHVLGKASRLRQDLGLKRKFIDFWLQTYEPKALRAALETVTGRMITVSKMSSGSLQRPADEVSPFKGKALMKRLEKFLDAFLIQNQDMDQESFESSDSRDKTDAPAALYRRTVLRSMMLVILLDNAKTTTETSLSRCLFLASSPYKSSLAVLQGLARFLLPSCGDINKAIGQLDCQLSYEQRPLDEYNYAISNLAVDLRDGVRLTRIVELLLYPLASRQQRTNTLSKDTPDTQRSLSQRLKLPCLGRAVKAFNVKVALDALATTSEGRLLVSNIRAADIVDGHREKTIALLWGLVSKWGLPGLVDMDDLSQEIGQLKQRAISAGYEVETFSRTLNDLAQIGEPAVLLEQWASLVAQLRGLRPEDLPTNLNGGRVYEYILDEYEGHLIDLDQTTVSTDGKTPLEARLRALGCSSPFVNIVFPSHKTYILDAHSATGALAFLCSRLLPAAKRVRAATVLQSAWRRVLFKRESRKRVMARDIARQCAAVVQTKDRILWAKSVIVHWWRLNRESRRRRRTTVSATRTKSLSRKSTRIPLRCMKHI